MRAFLCVEAPPELPGLPTAPAEAPRHLTLAFLADVPDARADELVTVGTDVAAAHPRFELVLGGFGAFPSPERPRVVFIGVRNGGDALAGLAAALRTALDLAGLRADARPFQPHLTVLRVRRPADLVRAREMLDTATSPPSVRFPVDEVLVKSSELGRGGAVHTTIGRCPVRAEAPT